MNRGAGLTQFSFSMAVAELRSIAVKAKTDVLDFILTDVTLKTEDDLETREKKPVRKLWSFVIDF